MLRNLLYSTAVLISICVPSRAQQIIIDGKFDDWNNIPVHYTDGNADGQLNSVDFRRIWIHDDKQYIYLSFETTKELIIQEEANITILLDFDNDINTGFKINGIGAEFRWSFGDRYGIINKNNTSELIGFEEASLFSAPTVSSSRFEMAFRKNIQENGITVQAESTIRLRIEDNDFNGDDVPNDLVGILYDMADLSNPLLPPFDLERADATDFRIMTYNIEADNLFDPSRKSSFARTFRAIAPDIIALQEVRNYTSGETQQLIDEFLPGQWYHKKIGFDIVMISKYPIVYDKFVAGNGAFIIDVDGQDVMIINCHLPCCENDVDRQEEVDIIMAYVKDVKSNNVDYSVQEGMPIIITGDMNLVGKNQVLNTMLTGDIFANVTYGADFLPDWDESHLTSAHTITTGQISNFTWYNPFGSFLPAQLDWVIYTDSRLTELNAVTLFTRGLTSSDLQDYQLQFTDFDNSSDHAPVVVDFAFGIVNSTEVAYQNFNIFPNPCEDFITISTDIPAHAFEIYSIDGKLLMQDEIAHSTKISIAVNSIGKGYYFLKLISDEGSAIQPFVK